MENKSPLVSYEQPTSAPVPKVQAVGVAGSIATLILLIGTMTGIDFRPEQVDEAIVGVSALVTLITFAAGYFKKDIKPKEAVKEIQKAG